MEFDVSGAEKNLSVAGHHFNSPPKFPLLVERFVLPRMLSRLFKRKTSTLAQSTEFGAARRDLFVLESMEPRVLLSAAPIDVPHVVADTSAVPVTQTPSSSTAQHSPAPVTNAQLPGTPPSSASSNFVFGPTLSLPGVAPSSSAIVAPVVAAGGGIGSADSGIVGSSSSNGGGVQLNPNIDGSSNTVGTGSATSTVADVTTGSDTTTASSGGTSTSPTDTTETSSSSGAPTGNPMTERMVDSLTAPSGPPTGSLSSTFDVTDSLSHLSASIELALDSGSLHGFSADGSPLSSLSNDASALSSLASSLLPGFGSGGGVSINSTTSVASLSLNSGDTTTINIGGTTAGSGYDQIVVSGNASLNGTLAVNLTNGFVPQAGQTFDFLTFGSLTGSFSSTTGLFFANGSQRFEIVTQADRLQLVVTDLPGSIGGLSISALTSSARDALGNLFSNYFTNVGPLDVTGLDLSFGGFVTLSGSFGFQKTGGLITATGHNISASLSAGGSSAGISSADIAVQLNTNGNRLIYGSGGFAISAGSGFASASGNVTVALNSGSAFSAQTLTVGSISVAVPALGAGVQTLSGTGLSVGLGNFVTLSGDFGFRKNGSGDLEIAIANAGALLNASGFSVGVTGATAGIVLPAAGGIAFQTTGGSVALTLPSAIAGASAASVSASYNTTGSAINTTVTVGVVTAGINIASGSVATPFSSVSFTGFAASIFSFASIGGNFAFSKNASGDLSAIVTNGSAQISTTGGAFSAGVTSASLALEIKSGGGFVLNASGTAAFTLPAQIGSASATVTVAYNSTGAAVNGDSLSIAASPPPSIRPPAHSLPPMQWSTPPGSARPSRTSSPSAVISPSRRPGQTSPW